MIGYQVAEDGASLPYEHILATPTWTISEKERPMQVADIDKDD